MSGARRMMLVSIMIVALVCLGIPFAVVLRHRGEWASLSGGFADLGDGAYRSAPLRAARGRGAPPLVTAAAALAIAIGTVLVLLILGMLVLLILGMVTAVVVLGAKGAPAVGLVAGMSGCVGAPIVVLTVLLLRIGFKLARPGAPTVGQAKTVGVGLVIFGGLVGINALVQLGAQPVTAAIELAIALLLTCSARLLYEATLVNRAVVADSSASSGR